MSSLIDDTERELLMESVLFAPRHIAIKLCFAPKRLQQHVLLQGRSNPPAACWGQIACAVAAVAGVAGAGSGAGAASSEAAAGDDGDFGAPQPGSEFSKESPMEGDLGGDSFDWDQAGML